MFDEPEPPPLEKTVLFQDNTTNASGDDATAAGTISSAATWLLSYVPFFGDDATVAVSDSTSSTTTNGSEDTRDVESPITDSADRSPTSDTTNGTATSTIGADEAAIIEEIIKRVRFSGWQVSGCGFSSSTSTSTSSIWGRGVQQIDAC